MKACLLQTVLCALISALCVSSPAVRGGGVRRRCGRKDECMGESTVKSRAPGGEEPPTETLSGDNEATSTFTLE